MLTPKWRPGPVGVLIFSIIYGCLASHWTILAWPTGVLSLLSKGGSMLFIAALGLRAGQCIAPASLFQKIRWLAAGIIPALTGVGMALLLHALLPSASDWGILGLFAGALTATPALSLARELPDVQLGALLAGYGEAYPLGSVLTVLWIRRQTRRAPRKETPAASYNKEGSSSLQPMFLSILFGSALGLLCGTTLGILLTAFFVGHLLKKGNHLLCLRTLSRWQSRGLSLFLIGNGMAAGQDFLAAARIEYILCGALMTTTALLSGHLATRFLFKIPPQSRLTVQCAGMTSTPAFGSLQAVRPDLADPEAYAVTYVTALLMMTVGTRLLYELLIFL